MDDLKMILIEINKFYGYNRYNVFPEFDKDIYGSWVYRLNLKGSIVKRYRFHSNDKAYKFFKYRYLILEDLVFFKKASRFQYIILMLKTLLRRVKIRCRITKDYIIV